MRPLRAVCCGLLLAGVSVSQSAFSAKHSCTVSGQVIEEPGGLPLRKVLVSLMRNGEFADRFRERGAYSAISDAEGHFQITGVAPAEYRVSLERPGFVSATRRSRTLSPLVVSAIDGHDVTGLLFGMLPAGVIQGKIADEDGDPLPNVSVFAISPNRQGISATGMTNDLGEYRIAGLAEGKYLVMAQVIRRRIGVPGDDSQVYPPTYFPGSTDSAQASVIEVHPGEESSASLNVTPVRTFKVRGRVSGLPLRTGTSPQAANTVLLSPTDSQLPEQFNGVIAADGNFEITGVPPGSYRAAITTQDGDVWRRVRSGQIEVHNSDLEGLQLVPELSGEVRGRFRMVTGKTWIGRNWMC